MPSLFESSQDITALLYEGHREIRDVGRLRRCRRLLAPGQLFHPLREVEAEHIYGDGSALTDLGGTT